MNNICSLFQDNFKTISVQFQEGYKLYTYKCLKDVEIEDGDTVVVFARNEYKCATVKAVHENSEIDYDSNITYKWIVQKVDTNLHDEILESEAKFAKAFKQIRKKALKKKAVDQFKEFLGEDEKTLLDDAIKILLLENKNE